MNSPTLPALRADAQVAATVRTAGRLHLGFLDPSGTLGRRFGSVGVVVDGFETEVELRPAEHDGLAADSAAARAELPRVTALLSRLRERTGLHAPLALQLRRVLPGHAGFGSGTQLALAVGRAFAVCHRIDVDTPTLAAWLGRGLRSGIGIAGFDQGGLLVDGGPGADGRPAPVISRVTPPEAWRVIVVQDPQRRGLSGEAERAALARLSPLPRAAAADLCHQVLMRVLPGAAAGEFETFAAGVNRLQERLGEHFAPAQDGSAWTSPAVGRLLAGLRARAGDAIGIGQSSWGPTGFGFVPSEAAAQALLASARAAGLLDPALAVHVVAFRNRGARVHEQPLR
jgi:beta-ribofuranosylaminobenzene 5'-phosphate synthase